MTITLSLKPEIEARLSEQAGRTGLPVEAYVESVIEAAIKPESTGERILALLAEWDAADATDDPAEIEARRAEWEVLKTQIDLDRTSNRPLFP